VKHSIDAPRVARWSPSGRWVGAGVAGLTLALAASQSRVTLLIWALDGAMALVIVLAAMLAGFAGLRWSGLKLESLAWRCGLAAGLGIGFLSTLVLVCGVCGGIGPERRWVAPALLAVAGSLGLVQLVRSVRATDLLAPAAGRWSVLWLLAAPAFALMLVVATAPPGWLWIEEGRGYDVLEYHLQLPKEYFTQGCIAYLPHNVYANFPSSAEMLYLFAAMVTGEPIEFWPVAKCLNALLAGLFVLAAWLVGRTDSPQAGVVAGVLAASSGWTLYLSGIAYVESGLLFLGMLSCGCGLRAVRDCQNRMRWLAVAGVMAGLACGFKYTALALVVFPLLALPVIAIHGSLRHRLTGSIVFGVAALLAFSPWGIKNVAMTGNPVFPLLHTVFPSEPAGWGSVEAEHFATSHAPSDDETALSGRLKKLSEHLILDPPQRIGVGLILLAALGGLRRRDRVSLGLGVVLLLQASVWLFATHLYARFAVPLLIPLIALAGRGVADAAGKVRALPVMLMIAVVGSNLYFAGRLYVDHYFNRDGRRFDVEGGSGLFTAGHLSGTQHLATINSELPVDAKLLLVGEARAFYFQRPVDYCVVFNRSPFVTIAEASPTLDRVLAWLHAQGYTHVFVNWSEIDRLRASRYGFPQVVTRSLFEQLEDIGLQRVADFPIVEGGPPYATLFAVPAPSS
jgi:phage shock protein PspC (stress-responsive transcriptional regulator)